MSSISGAKTETSSVDASLRTSSSHDEADRSGELSVSVSNASDQEREWVEEDEPGVYITIRALPGGMRELRRVRFRLVLLAQARQNLFCRVDLSPFYMFIVRLTLLFSLIRLTLVLNASWRAVERGSVRCMQGGGGKKTVQEYMNNISEKMENS